MEIKLSINKAAKNYMDSLNSSIDELSNEKSESIVKVALIAIAVFTMTLAYHIFQGVEFLTREKKIYRGFGNDWKLETHPSPIFLHKAAQKKHD